MSGIAYKYEPAHARSTVREYLLYNKPIIEELLF